MGMDGVYWTYTPHPSYSMHSRNGGNGWERLGMDRSIGSTEAAMTIRTPSAAARNLTDFFVI